MFSLKPKYKMWRVFDQPIGTFVYFFVRCDNFALYHNKRLLRADPCCRSVIKEFARAFSCAYIELDSLGKFEEHSKSKSCSLLRLELLLHIFRALQSSHVHP